MWSAMRKLSLLALISSFSIGASANLIINGGFESQNVNTGGWAWFTADNVDGWNGSNIEIWDTYGGFAAFEGTQHAELNAHPSNGAAFSIFQTFDTQIGTEYQLSFAYSARSSTNEAFEVNLFSDSSSLMSQIIDDHLIKQWSVFNTSFVATDSTTTLSFTSVTPYSGTIGNFLDAVSVEGVPGGATDVDEPMSLLLVLAGLGMLMRRRQRA